MKRILSLCLVALILAAAVVCAAAESAVTVTVGSIEGEIGDVVQVPVSISDSHYAVNGRIFLTYDPTVLELQQVCDNEENPYFEDVNTSIIDSSFMWAFASPVAGRANFVFFTSAKSGNAVGGDIFTLTFKLLKEADTTITATIPELRCNNGEGSDYDAPLTVVNGDVAVTVVDNTPAMRGDTNGDGMLTLADATRLFYFVNGGVTLTKQQTANADINQDGSVTLADASRLFYFISGQSDL